MKSNNILPSSVFQNIADASPRYFKFHRQHGDVSPLLFAIAYKANLFFGKFCKMVFGSFVPAKPCFPSMSLIEHTGAPLKILGAIISLDSVFVIYFRMFHWVNYIVKGNQSMNKKLPLNSRFYVKRNNVITSPHLPWFKKNSLMSSLPIARMSEDTPITRHGIDTIESLYSSVFQYRLYYHGLSQA